MHKLVLLSALLLTAHGADAPQLPHWLAGSWKMTNSRGATIDETWNTPAAGLMMGMSRTYTADKVRSWEFVRIEQRGGSLVYIAQPQGAPPTEFKLIKHEDGYLLFANPQHDFPKQISYRRIDADHLTARVDDGQGKGTDFAYTRMK
jgi:hypothetical protein